MIRITRGTFGWFDGRRVVPKNAESEPFVADRELEARLVAKGMAEYVGDSPAAPVPDGAGQTPATVRADLADMTKAELEELAKGYGIPVARKTKAQLVKAIEGADVPPAPTAAEAE